MTESEIRTLIRKTIRQELAQILMGSNVTNQDQNYSSVRRFDESPMPNVRKLLPFGLSSRAPSGTEGLIIPVDGNPTHLVSAGDFDSGRPTTEDGETILYDQFGHVIYLSENKIQVGSKASAENLVLGQIFKTFAHNLLQKLQAETHIGNLGYATSVPVNAADYAALQASPIDDSAILSDKAFTEK